MAKHPNKLILVVMDGIGSAPAEAPGNAVALAYTPMLDQLLKGPLATKLYAHGPYVGLPDLGDMGNSEVGHNALGAGRIFDQGAKLVGQALSSGSLFHSPAYQKAITQVRQNQSTLHFLGLLSDGNVHSHQDHLHALLRQAKKDGVQKVRLHLLFDGRDVPERSAEIYLERLAKVMLELRSPQFDLKIASGGGRMHITMDRYNADWAMVERGYQAHVRGLAPNHFASAEEALSSYRQDPKLSDQFLPAFVIHENGDPVGPILKGDSLILFNFRGDRAIEISRCFDEESFTYFDRGPRPDIFYAGMMSYDGDLPSPRHFLVEPPQITNTLSESLCHQGIRQYASSETQKFGHVTYFWNGNRSGKIDPALEEYVEIPSDQGQFELRPWMKADEITRSLEAALKSNNFDFLRINLANGDMVGHTGDLAATVQAVGAVDLALRRIWDLALKYQCTLLVTADHGNAEEMIDAKGQIKTSHTLNQVPLAIAKPGGELPFKLSPLKEPGLANIANTVITLLGLEPSSHYHESLIKNV